MDKEKSGIRGSNIHVYGILPFYQIHFIIKSDGKMYGELLLARTRKKVTGVINKRVEDVWWEGGKIVDRLNNDPRLKELLLHVIKDEGDIFIDPTDNAIRIYSRFKGEHELKLSKEVIEIFNLIAGHVKHMIKEFE